MSKMVVDCKAPRAQGRLFKPWWRKPMPLFESSAVCLDKKRKTLRGMNEPSKVMKRCFFSTSVRLLEKKKKKDISDRNCRHKI